MSQFVVSQQSKLCMKSKQQKNKHKQHVDVYLRSALVEHGCECSLPRGPGLHGVISKCMIAQYFGWICDKMMAQQHRATCQAYNYKWTGCSSVSGLQLEMKASRFTLFSHTGLL